MTKTKHMEVQIVLNGVKGTFIVDTGASNTCVGMQHIDKFNMITEKSEVKAAGAGATGMETLLSKSNVLELGKCKLKKVDLVLFGLDHVNAALTQHGVKPVDGILGADILERYAAIVDYKKMQLYLKK